MDRFRDKIPDAIRALKTGKSNFRGQERVEIDYNSGLLVYDTSSFQQGIKSGGLRSVQYSLMRLLINKIREKKSYGEVEILIPTNILERIDYLAEHKILNLTSGEVQDIKYAYGIVLYIHHMTQLGNLENNETTFNLSGEDLKELRIVTQTIEKLVGKMK